MIPHRDLLSFTQGLLALYAPGLDLENYPERSFRFLTRLVPAELTVHGIRDIASDHANIILHFDRFLPQMEDAIQPFGLLGPKYPWFCAHPETHQGRPHYRSDFYSDREYRNLDIHSEIFRRWNHEHFMTMCVHAEGGRVVFFGFSRARNDFSRRERWLLEQAQLHLISSRQLAASLSAAKPWSLTPDILSRHGFTPRESEVLYWLTEGKSNIEIGVILRIGLATVKGYLTAIFNKTGTNNRLAATLHAVELAKKARMQQVVPEKSPLLFSTPWVPNLTKAA